MSPKLKVLLGGLLIGSAIIFVADSTTNRYATLVRQLETICEQQDLGLHGKWQPVCQADDLMRFGGGGAIEVQIIAAEVKRQTWQARSNWLTPLGMAIIILAALPWTWLFLLNRIRELSNAVAGRS